MYKHQSLIIIILLLSMVILIPTISADDQTLDHDLIQQSWQREKSNLRYNSVYQDSNLSSLANRAFDIPPDKVQIAIRNIIDSVSPVNLKSYTKTLQNFGSRLYRAPGMFNASIWLHDILKGNGRLVPSYHNFTVVRPTWGTFTLSNVILTLPGLNESSDRIYYMFAHSDAVQFTDSNQWLTNTPGADDDASGCAATLEAARILSRYKFQDTIKFAFFNAEEIGLVGAYNYAENMSNWGENVWGSIDYDMIGYSVGAYEYDLNLRYNSASAAQGIYEVDVNDRYNIGLTINAVETSSGIPSDIQVFYNFGFPGVFAIEYDFNPYYHSTSDLVKYLNFTLVDKCTRLATASLAEMARLLYTDLTIKPGNMTFSDTQPLTGEDVNITVNISNTGNLDAFDFEVVFYSDGSPFDTKIISVPANGTNTTNATWHSTLGIHNISVVLDPKNEIVEIDETNNSVWLNIVVNDRPKAILFAIPQAVLTNEPVTFNGSLSYDIYGEVAQYNFSFGDGNYSGWINDSETKHSYPENGFYNASLIVSDIYNAISEAMNITIQVNNRPPIADPGCNKSSAFTFSEIQFYANATDPDGLVNTHWYFGDGFESNEEDPIHVYTKSGVYDVILNVQDDDEAVEEYILKINIKNRKPNCIINANPLKGNITTKFEFGENITDLDDTLFKVHWYFGDGTNKTYSYKFLDNWRKELIIHSYSKPGIYDVILMVFDNESAMAKANVTITVLDLPPKAVAGITPTQINTSEVVYFTAVDSYDLEGPLTYYWSYGDGNIATEVTTEHIYTQPGIFHPTLTVKDTSDQADTLELSPVLVQNRAPVADFQALGNFSVNGTIFFDGSGSYDPESGITYYWDFGDDTTSDLGPITDHSYTEAGNYTVILTVKDDEGSTNTKTQVVTIKPPPKPDITPIKPQSPESDEADDSSLVLGLIAIIIVLIILIILLSLLILRRRKEPPEPPPATQSSPLPTPVPDMPSFTALENQILPPVSEPGEIIGEPVALESTDYPQDTNAQYLPDQEPTELSPGTPEYQEYTAPESYYQPGVTILPPDEIDAVEPSTQPPLARPVKDDKTTEQ